METAPRKKRNQSQAQLDNIKPFQFKKGEVQIDTGGGRKPNRVKELLKSILSVPKLKQRENLSAEEINTIEKSIMALSIDELKAVIKNKETCAYMKTLINAAFIDLQNGRTQTMDKLRDRQYGTVTTKSDITSKGNPLQNDLLIEIIDHREQVTTSAEIINEI